MEPAKTLQAILESVIDVFPSGVATRACEEQKCPLEGKNLLVEALRRCRNDPGTPTYK
jgi:hypothetical protein